MREPWQIYLRLGVVHFMLYPECLGGDGPAFETLETICHDEFFDAVDIGPINDPEERLRCAALLRDCQMDVSFAAQPLQLANKLDINSADNTARREAVESICALIPQAKELGANRFVLMSGVNVPPRERSHAIDRLLESLRTICARVRDEAGLPVILEIFDYDVDKKALVGPCQIAGEVARRMRQEFRDFGLLHDLSHIYLCHEDPAEHFPIIREFLIGMHLGNSVSDPDHPLFGDTHPMFGAPGSDNDVPELRAFLKTLFDIGYLRPGRRPLLGFETRTPEGIKPKTVVANMKRTWQQAWWTL